MPTPNNLHPTPDAEYIRDVMTNLIDHGYAVVVWTPEEIGEGDSDLLQDLMIERGHQYLEQFEEDS